MIETVLIVGGILLIAGLAWLIFRTETRGGVNGEGGGLAPEFERFERELRVAIADGRKEVLEAAKTQREELSTSISRLAKQHQDDQRGGREEMAAILKRFGESVDQRLQALTEANDRRLAEVRQTLEEKLKSLQDDNA